MGWSQNPGGLLPGATHVSTDEPFKRWPTAQEKLHFDPKLFPHLFMRNGLPEATVSVVQLITERK